MGVSSEKYHSRLSRGLCPHCGGRREVPDRNLCSSCASKHRAATKRSREKRKARGQCAACNEKVHKKGARYCRGCATGISRDSVKRKRAWIEAGLCRWCGRKPLASVGVCRVCWFKEMSGRCFGNHRHAELLETLFKQQEGRCYYTGRRLMIGRNASIDHQIPKSRGGSLKVQNLRWVHIDVNQAKHAMTHNEFVKMCRLIASRHGRE